MTTCSTGPITRCYSKKIQTISQPIPQPIHHTTVVQTPKPDPPQITVVHLKSEEPKCKAPCTEPKCIDTVELSDEETEIKPLPPAPAPPVVGVTPDEFGLLQNEVGALKKALQDLNAKLNENGVTVDQKLQILLDNMKNLEQRVFNNEKGVTANRDNIKALRDEIDLLKSQLNMQVGKLKGQLKGLSAQDFTGVLGALEQEIKRAGGINIGDRWRLRFKDDANKDIFLQDRSQKGYYRFRTTKCDRLVKSCKANCNCVDNY